MSCIHNNGKLDQHLPLKKNSWSQITSGLRIKAKSLLDLLHNSGYPGIKIEKKVDLENLYNQKFN